MDKRRCGCRSTLIKKQNDAGWNKAALLPFTPDSVRASTLWWEVVVGSDQGFGRTLPTARGLWPRKRPAGSLEALLNPAKLLVLELGIGRRTCGRSEKHQLEHSQGGNFAGSCTDLNPDAIMGDENFGPLPPG